MVASDGVLSEGCGHDGPGVCLGDGQTEAEGVPWQGGCGEAYLAKKEGPMFCTNCTWVGVTRILFSLCHRPTSWAIPEYLVIHEWIC